MSQHDRNIIIRDVNQTSKTRSLRCFFLSALLVIPSDGVTSAARASNISQQGRQRRSQHVYSALPVRFTFLIVSVTVDDDYCVQAASRVTDFFRAILSTTVLRICRGRFGFCDLPLPPSKTGDNYSPRTRDIIALVRSQDARRVVVHWAMLKSLPAGSCTRIATSPSLCRHGDRLVDRPQIKPAQLRMLSKQWLRSKTKDSCVDAVCVWQAAHLKLISVLRKLVRQRGRRDSTFCPPGPGVAPWLWLRLRRL